MARKAFEKIMAGMEDALAYAEGDATLGVAHKVEIHEVERLELLEDLQAAERQLEEGRGIAHDDALRSVKKRLPK